VQSFTPSASYKDYVRWTFATFVRSERSSSLNNTAAKLLYCPFTISRNSCHVWHHSTPPCYQKNIDLMFGKYLLCRAALVLFRLAELHQLSPSRPQAAQVRVVLWRSSNQQRSRRLSVLVEHFPTASVKNVLKGKVRKSTKLRRFNITCYAGLAEPTDQTYAFDFVTSNLTTVCDRTICGAFSTMTTGRRKVFKWRDEDTYSSVDQRNNFQGYKMNYNRCLRQSTK